MKLAALKDGRYIEMGNTGLMLNIITPLQKFSKGGTTLSDVIRQRFQDLFERELSKKTLLEVEDYFTKKKEVIEISCRYLNLKRTRQSSKTYLFAFEMYSSQLNQRE